MNHFIKKSWGIFGLLLLSVFINKIHAQGAGKAMHFAGTTANEHVNLGQALSDSLGSRSFTLEMWIKVNGTGGDPAFIGNKNWDNGANTGIAWVISSGSATQLKFNFKPVGGTRLDPVVTIPTLTTAWNHIAAVVTRPATGAGSIVIYVNGIQTTTATIAAADTGKTVSGLLPLQLAQDGTGTYSYKFNGDIDELRIWNAGRTAQDIRDNMCHKLTGSESNLMAYYRMDETSTTNLVNSAVNYASSFVGTQVNNPAHVNSAAAIGDASANLYAASFTGQTLALGTAFNGNMQLSNIGSSMTGIHLYRIDAAPNTTAGIANAGSNNVYYGVFPVSTTATYDMSYDYTNFPNAITYESGTGLFERFSVDSTWVLGTAAKNQLLNTFSKTATNKRTELIIGNFANLVTCNTPTALSAQSITANNAVLSWTTGGSNRWNISYGTGTPNAATGTLVSNLSSANYTPAGLTANSTYWFYVQDTCSSIGSTSAWAGPVSFTTLMDYGVFGSGYAINFQGTSANEHVNLGDSLSGTLAKTNFTIETWIKFNNPSSDPAFIANKDWDSGLNTGFAWCWNGNSNLRFNFRTANGTRKDYDVNVPNASKWNHIAMVVDRAGFLTAYLNGIQVGTPLNIAVDSGKTLDGILPVRIGQDGTGVYGPKFKGAMDELRIWSKALTQAEIRANMCHKLQSNDTGLLAYYRMDETSGNTLTNNAGNNVVVFNGTLMGNPQRQISGAAIGDTSIYLYASNWSGLQAQLGSLGMGNVIIDSISNAVTGIHIYRVNNAPNYQNGIVNIGTTNQYFGVFTSGNYDANYKIQYDYSSYSNAVANNANVHLYNRANNGVTNWIQLPATNVLTSNKMHMQQNLGVKEFLLADFVAALCAAPDSVTVSNIDTGGAIIKWASNSAHHIIQYGLSGFNLGNGTNVIDTDDSLHLNNLAASTAYEFYIEDSCSAINSSAWVGPFSFVTVNPCSEPANLSADSITTSRIVLTWQNTGIVTTGFGISWGPSGFGDPNIGILQTVADTFSVFTGLSANISYDFYIRANCNSNVANSMWMGPYTFTTIACDIPSALAVNQITTASAKISWSSAAIMHHVQYGTAGFTIGTGTIQSNVTTASYTLSGLSAATAYDVYVQDSCSDILGNSTWVGPVSFTTAAATGINEVNAMNDILIFPNPASDLIIVRSKEEAIDNVAIFNNIGQMVSGNIVANHKNEVTISLDHYATGIYLIRITTVKGIQVVKRVIVQQKN